MGVEVMIKATQFFALLNKTKATWRKGNYVGWGGMAEVPKSYCHPQGTILFHPFPLFNKARKQEYSHINLLYMNQIDRSLQISIAYSD